MPRSTSRHRFEFTVLNGCCALAERLCGGNDRGCGFRAAFDAEGNLLAAICQPSAPDFRDARLDGAATIFFDPFDAPEYTYIAWSGFTRAAMERALSIRFGPHDLPDGVELPADHDVMF